MRRPLIMMAVALPLAGAAVPGLAFDRPAMTAGATSAVVPAADLDRPRDVYRPYARDSYFHWRYRSAYSRWLHNEYRASGYPVRHQQFRVYAREWPCCQERRWWR